MKVIVIGAGISGLACADLLSTQPNIEITVLEARERIGGRITNAPEFSCPIDLGASWIHGVKGNPLTSIAKRLGLNIDVTENPNLTGEGGFEVYSPNGSRVEKNLEKEARKKFSCLIDEAVNFLEEIQEDVSVEKALQMANRRVPPHARQISSSDEKDFLNWLRAGIEGWENANLSQLSGRYHFLEWEYRIPLGGDGFVLSGFYNVINELAKNIQEKILIGQEVHEIEYNDDGVIVRTNKDEFYADFVVSTLPLGVLKTGDIKFSPPLPVSKMRAIQYLGFGLMNKIVLEFDNVFWNPDTTGIGYISNEPSDSFQFFMNLFPFLKRPVLMCFITADFAREVEKWADEKILGVIEGILEKIYGKGKDRRPRVAKITRWGSDPYSRGSYSFRTVGSTVQDIENLAKPIGRLHFAGEATYIDLGFAHGAYLSGRRAAQEVLQAHNRPTVSHFRHISSKRRPSI